MERLMFTFVVGAGMEVFNDEEIARYFRESDRLGHESSLLLRLMRRLIADRKPPGLVTPLAFTVDGRPIGHFGALYTGRDRICFYPAYPSGTDMTKQVDHITLEISSGKSHATRYDAEDKPHRFTPEGRAWRLSQFPSSPIALWIQYLMRWDTIHKQDALLQRSVDGKSPAGAEHAEAAFIEYAKGIQQPIGVPVYPTSHSPPNYALCMLYYAGSHPHEDLKFEPAMFNSDGLAKSITGFDPEVIVNIQAVAFNRGGHSFIAVAACPPGEMNDSAVFGFPYKGTS